MRIFRLPDLGEGLPDAIIREWYIKVGDTVISDQPLVSMETAKALVDIPSPFSGKIEKLYGEPGDIIETGHPLIAFEGQIKTSEDAGTVVGTLETSEAILQEPATGITIDKSKSAKKTTIKATPAIRLLAKQLGVDLSTITPQGTIITAEEVKQAAQHLNRPSQINSQLIPLSNVQRAMARNMSASHQEIVPVSLMDDVDIHSWSNQKDTTIRLIRAIETACQAVPIMNAHFNGQAMVYKENEFINIGLAVDTPYGLYVPVLKDVAHQSDADLRQHINRFKEQAQNRSFHPEDLRDATIMLSNFGTLAGRYANPILIPPLVTIVGVGRIREAVLPIEGKPTVRRILPLSITSDHRLITGGQIARFLKALIDSLEEK